MSDSVACELCDASGRIADGLCWVCNGTGRIDLAKPVKSPERPLPGTNAPKGGVTEP